MFRFRKALAALVLVSSPLSAALPAAAQDAGDPPADVARVAVISGTVSFHQPGSQEWQAAQQNYPLAPGSGVWTEPRSRVAVDVAGARVHLDASTQLEVTAIAPGSVQLAVPQGAAILRVYPGVSGVHFEVDTAHGAAYIDQPGQYEIVAGDDQYPSSVSVLEGEAQMVGQGVNLALQAGQRGNIAPDNGTSVDQAPVDDFVRLVQANEQPYQQQVVQTAQYVSPQQTGYQDLARYGQWSQASQYGAVWYPRGVPANWAPYRYGHWAYVAPWGWTWVDDQPWGFTPFHYGRWVTIDHRWAWVPGQRAARPVYAPALVSFFDLGGVGVSLSLGWVPLGPDEVYVPTYRHSPSYVRAVNITNVRNQTTIINVVNRKTVVQVDNYKNYRGATSVSRDVMAHGRPVEAAWSQSSKAKRQQQWTHAKPQQAVSFQPQGNAGVKPASGPKASSQQQRTAKPIAPAPSKTPAPQAQPQKTRKSVDKPKNNGAPQPYLPPSGPASQKIDAPAAKSKSAQSKNAAPTVVNTPATAKPGKDQTAKNPTQNVRSKKNQQSPVIYPAATAKPAKQQPKQEQAAKKSKAQQQKPQAQQQWKQHGQSNQNQHAEKTQKGNPQQPAQQRKKPVQDCGQQPGACQP